MSEIEYIQNKVEDIVRSAYNKSPWFAGSHDMAMLIANDTISKKPLETDKALVKTIEIDPTISDVKELNEFTEKHNPHKSTYDVNAEAINKIKAQIYVEMIPKKSINATTTFDDAINMMYDVIGKDYNYDGVSLSGLSEGFFMRDRKFLDLEYDKNHQIGFSIIAEYDKAQNKFQYPTMKNYTSPTIFFTLYAHKPESNLEIVNRLYSAL